MPVPASYPRHLLSAYSSPSAFPPALWDAFRSRERAANIMYPHALKALKARTPPPPNQLWISLATKASPTASPVVELVLSCTSWAMGDYPIFIFTTVPFAALSYSWLHGRLRLLAAELLRAVPVSRVYSVFAPAPVTKTFVRVWQSLTGAVPVSEPYYAASFSFCTPDTFRAKKQASAAQEPGVIIRQAVEADIPRVASLCKGFASTSEPFVLDDQGAAKEAGELVRSGVLWLHVVATGGSEEIASIVATTRQSESVSAITKVYTNPLFRSQGCAERLVRRVCQHLLFKERKESVVLFVAHDNLAAAKVYDRVGFTGLCDKPRVDGVDPWVEVGFHAADVGHW